MRNDIRMYGYKDDAPLISRIEQAKEYFDDKFANIIANVDLTEIETKIAESTSAVQSSMSQSEKSIIDNISSINTSIDDAKSEIIEAVEDSKPCLCNIATKDDIKQSKTDIINEIDNSKDLIIKEIDDKFVNLNELVQKS